VTQVQRLRVLGVVLILLGISTTVLGVVRLFETEWDVDPLRYEDVQYLGGYRAASSIHIVSDDGQTYRLPRRLWPEGVNSFDLVARLREERTAIARVTGGENRFWFGYPIITYLETASLTLEASPQGPLRTTVLLLLGPVLAIGGVLVGRRVRDGRSGPGSPGTSSQH
jgi:hypothetical protein